VSRHWRPPSCIGARTAGIRCTTPQHGIPRLACTWATSGPGICAPAIACSSRSTGRKRRDGKRSTSWCASNDRIRRRLVGCLARPTGAFLRVVPSRTRRSSQPMRLIGAASIVFVLAMAHAISGFAPAMQTELKGSSSGHDGEQTLRDGRAIFRFDTFGDEQLWTDVLRMHEAVATVNPATALAVGLKVDVDALPTPVIAALQAGQVDLTNPAVTVELLRLNAVVGVKGTVSDTGQLTKVGITCALCHSSVDDSFAPGIGKRLDGWANTDLNVGAIVALSPALDEATKAEFRTWGPGKYDPRHHAFDGTNIVPLNNPSLPIVIPSIYGLKGVGFEP